MFLLTVLDGSGRTLVRPLDTPVFVDLAVFRGVSTDSPYWLVTFEAHTGHALVRDADNRTRIELRPDETVTLDGLTLTLQRPDTHRTESVITARTRVPLALQVRDRRSVPLDGRTLTVGAWMGCDLVLDDSAVSQRHCEIEPLGDTWIVRDLASTNGLRVHGVRVPWVLLDEGVRVTLGRTVIECVPAAPSQTATGPLLGSSPAMERLREEVAKAAEAPYPVLIHGESGAGKELVARELHARSGRRGAMVSLNCGAIAKELIESELFGHERGAFSGAHTMRRGLFEQAHDGTLFLDELGELPLDLQPRLLRVLETRELRRVGGDTVIPVNVRVVSATHRDLLKMVRAGTFRLDLYYRLCDFKIEVPPLRARVGDIRALSDALLRRIGHETGRHRILDDRALARLMLAPWPGNVRDLFAALKRAVFATEGHLIGADDLDLDDASTYRRAPTPPQQVKDTRWPNAVPYGDLVALHTFCGENVSRTARLSGLARATVRARLRKLTAQP